VTINPFNSYMILIKVNQLTHTVNQILYTRAWTCSF